MLNPPFSIRAEKAGLKSLGTAVKAIGPYQATGGFVMRAWGKANEDTLVKYLQAYIEGVRWTLDPANKEEAVELLMDRLKLAEDVASQAYRCDAEGLPEGRQRSTWTACATCSSCARSSRAARRPTPEKYIDLSYYQKAKAGTVSASRAAVELPPHPSRRVALQRSSG